MTSQLIPYPALQGKKVFSQNDEDGALEAVFDYVATTDKIYVEFGVESCQECNSRYLRSANQVFRTLVLSE